MMQTEPVYRIRGSRTISGTLVLQGSKNSLLPMLAGTILRPGAITIRAAPDITDKDALCEILTALGCVCTCHRHTLTIDSTNAAACPIPPQLMTKTRGAFVFLGAMLARFGSFGFALPGGCMLGKRPVDFHLTALRQMGAEFEEDGAGCMKASCTKLVGCTLSLPFPSVGATQNILLAACGAQGTTVLNGAAIEPEVIELTAFLRSRGFDVAQSGERQFTVHGTPQLCREPFDSDWDLSPDRIAAVTYLCAAALTGGSLHIPNLHTKGIEQAVALYRKAGCQITDSKDGVTLCAPDVLHGVGHITTAPHPGFATDMQPLFFAMLCYAEDKSSFTETIFENRFSHCAQLAQMGADIVIRQKTAYIRGGKPLTGRDLLAFDLRGGAALTIAALGASGDSILYGADYIRRGYDDLFGCLNRLGADIAPL